MASKLMIVISSFLILSLFGIVWILDFDTAKMYETTGLVVSAESFPIYIETHPLIKELPKDSAISLVIGNKIYRLSKNHLEIDKQIEKSDVIISLPNGYESIIGEKGLCNSVKDAVKNEELKFETKISKTKLFLKYRNLIKYRDCLGD
ncbi:hypothetical protein EXS72_00135 [Candidatus Pacearchaeota archaeon]|nr:hypothetical protein [Candidatus Pacearchaeota archaeon]